MNQSQSPTPFFHVLRLLLRAARRRAAARAKAQQELLHQRRGREQSINWGSLAVILALFFAALLQFLFFNTAKDACHAAQVAAYEKQGVIVLDSWDMHSVKKDWEAYASANNDEKRDEAKSDIIYTFERYARHHRIRNSSDKKIEAERLWNHLENNGIAGFINENDINKNYATQRPPVVDWVICIFILWWMMMMVFQGEGMELDMTRRRHPAWEWLSSHPITSSSWFTAEMISPLAANLQLFAAPFFWGGMFGWLHNDFTVGVMAGVLVGLPFAVALACLGKAIEIACMIRLSVRTRGAVLGIMSWIGYTSFILPMFFIGKPEMLVSMLRPFVGIMTIPLSVVNLIFGLTSSWIFGVLFCWFLVACIIAVAVIFSMRATEAALAGNDGGQVKMEATTIKGGFENGMRDPLFRKELLWLKRDRGALVQIFLIPLSMVLFQSYNLRHVTEFVGSAWNAWAGICVVMGTYFLYMLGPRSLMTEGAALWLPMTWPRSLEDLLMAKAKLWSRLAAGLVYTGLLFTLWKFPQHYWQIALVAVGWYFFGKSFSQRAVTLVRTPTNSGETEPLTKGQRYSVTIGMLSFAVGVFSQNFSLAITGVVYSWFTTAAIWQNFRNRLPHLFDPWSEKMPQAPTLVHAMVAISALVETIAMISPILRAIHIPMIMATAISYGSMSLLICVITIGFLERRDVTFFDVWFWSKSDHQLDWKKIAKHFSLTCCIGILLGGLGIGYVWAINQIPWLHEWLKSLTDHDSLQHNQKIWLYILTVGFAPFAEEYLFRGLFYRALDRIWGGWYAMIGCAMFFAIFHPAHSWLPVGLLGFVSCWLFKKTGCLSYCVLLHMIYNGIVTSLQF